MDKFMKKAHFFLENQKELGLKDDQLQTIKSLKIEAKKAYIRQMAEMEVFKLDLDQKMAEPKVDVKALDDMIDGMAAQMSAAAKVTVNSYAQLKAVLSDEQMGKAKEIWTKKRD